MPESGSIIEALDDRLVRLRHDLHAHPELGYQEKWTAARLLDELQTSPALKLRTGLAGTGILAELNADRAGPCVALRADMDALPVQEENDYLPYRSQQPGRMHACGHDGHMTCLVGAALALAQEADQLPGQVKFVFQPAEEGGAGGRRLVEEEGVLDTPRVSAAFALHGWPMLKVGQVMVGSGPVMAASCEIILTIRGRGAHAAFPHTGNDVVVAAAQVITALQAVASRWDPLDPVLVSICQVEAGHAHNVLPESCRLVGTVRALRQSSHQQVLGRVTEVAQRVAEAHGCQAELEVVPGYPTLVNDPTCAQLASEAARGVLGPDSVVEPAEPCLAGEDFAFFARQVPSAWIRLGVCPADRADYPSLHTPRYDFGDEAVPIGTRLLCEIARRYLTQPPLWQCG